MKKLILILIGFATLSAQAQMKEGRVIYERVMEIAIRSFGMDPNMAAQIPKSRTDQYELLFSNNKTLWQFLPTAENDGEQNTFASGGMVIRMQGANSDIVFHDLEKGSKVEHREIVNVPFVVSDTMSRFNWKLTDETKLVLGHTVRKATTTRINTRWRMSMENGEMKRTPMQDTAEVVAWFTTDIPVAAGPAEFQGQLPGLILEMQLGKNQTTYRALEISPKVSTSKIKAPKDGKKVTAAEFEKEREKLMQEMQKNMPAGGRIRIGG